MALRYVVDDLYSPEREIRATAKGPATHGLEAEPELRRDLLPARPRASALVRELNDRGLQLGRVQLPATGAVGEQSAAQRCGRKNHAQTRALIRVDVRTGGGET